MTTPYSVTTMIPTRSGFAWWVIEVEGNPTLDEISNRLIEDGALRVTKVDVENGAVPGQKVVVKRTDAILGIGMVGTILPLHIDLVERR